MLWSAGGAASHPCGWNHSAYCRWLGGGQICSALQAEWAMARSLEHSWLPSTLGSSPILLAGALSTHRPPPHSDSHTAQTPAVLGLCSASPSAGNALLRIFQPHSLKGFYTQLKYQPLGDPSSVFQGLVLSLLRGVIYLTDSPVWETLLLKQGPPDLCFTQPRCPHSTLQGRAEPTLWQP